MTPEQFAYWLQGCSELNPSMEAPSPEQWKVIKDHLATVFIKVTPPFPQKSIGVQPIDRNSVFEEKSLHDYMKLSPMVVTC